MLVINCKRKLNMKKYTILLPLISLLSIYVTQAQEVGFIIKETTTGSVTIKSPLYYVADVQNYTAGGITFVYPTDWFSGAPMVDVAIELTGMAYSSTATISACITSNSAGQTVVRVNINDNGYISEASTGDVNIHLYAKGP